MRRLVCQKSGMSKVQKAKKYGMLESLVCLKFGMSKVWFVKILVCQMSGMSKVWKVKPMVRLKHCMLKSLVSKSGISEAQNSFH